MRFKYIQLVLLFLLPLFISTHVFCQTDEEQIALLIEKLENTNTDTARINCLNKLAEIYVFIDANEAMIYLEEAIELGEQVGCLPCLSKSYRLKGIAYYYNYEFDSTLVFYNKSLVINEKLNDSVSIAKEEKNIGLIYHILSDFSEALIHYERSLEFFEKLNDRNGITDSYNNIGSVYSDQGNFEMALEYYFKSLKACEESENKQVMAATLANIGGIYEEQEKVETAMEYHKRANKIAFEIGDDYGLADTYTNIAGLYKELKYIDSARITYNKATELYLKLNDLSGLVIVYNQMGNLYIEEYHNDSKVEYLNQAANSFEQSLKINNENVFDKIEECVSYQGLGDIYIQKGENRKSIKFQEMALKTAIEIETGFYIKASYDRLSKAYARAGVYKKAYESHVLYKNWDDSLRNDENIEALTQMSMQYEFDKQQKEQEFIAMQKELEYEQKLKRQRIIRYTFIVGFVLVLLFAVQVLRSYQRKKRDNLLLEKQKAEIEKQKEEITDSIKYAKRIQTAILPSNDLASEILPEHFILFRPRDIVSGDYYWMNKVGNKVIVVAADCTGHGVPGAFMSMLGVSFLNEIVNKNNVHQANLILNHLRADVKKTLGQTGKEGEAKDGMDIAICVIDMDTKIMEYAGAYNPLYLYRNGELIETKADKMPIGIYIREKDSFTNHEIQLQKGDTFYIFSDGFADQFGGPDGGKFKSRPFKRLLGELQDMNMADQRVRLNRIFDDWRGEIEQIDDVIIVGVRI